MQMLGDEETNSLLMWLRSNGTMFTLFSPGMYVSLIGLFQSYISIYLFLYDSGNKYPQFDQFFCISYFLFNGLYESIDAHDSNNKSFLITMSRDAVHPPALCRGLQLCIN